MQVYTKTIVIDPSVRALCVRPYSNHPKGCPNFGKRSSCPPQARLVTDVFSMEAGFWLVWIEFDFATHCRKMREKHPEWSQRQIECCLYWQNTANKMLREVVTKFYKEHCNWRGTTCPEAMGINVTESMRQIGIKLEWPPLNIVRKVALFGKPV